MRVSGRMVDYIILYLVAEALVFVHRANTKAERTRRMSRVFASWLRGQNGAM